MWEMLEVDDCDDYTCGGSRPPEFNIPPPPMSPYLQELLSPSSHCIDDEPTMDTADLCRSIPVSTSFISFYF